MTSPRSLQQSLIHFIPAPPAVVSPAPPCARRRNGAARPPFRLPPPLPPRFRATARGAERPGQSAAARSARANRSARRRRRSARPAPVWFPPRAAFAAKKLAAGSGGERGAERRELGLALGWGSASGLGLVLGWGIAGKSAAGAVRGARRRAIPRGLWCGRGMEAAGAERALSSPQRSSSRDVRLRRPRHLLQR